MAAFEECNAHKSGTAKKELQDRVAIITGAAGEVGWATARRFASGGARLVLIDMDESLLRGLQEEVHALGSQALVIRADVTLEVEVRRIVGETLAAFHRIDILVNNAGIDDGHSWEQVDSDDWERHLVVNLTSCLLCCRAVTPHMQARSYGKVVNIASSAGRYRSSYFQYGASLLTGVPFAASNGGVLALTRELAFELAHCGIYVNAVVPGWILTDRVRKEWEHLPEWVKADILAEISLRRPGKPDEVAAVVYFLASDASSYVTATLVDVNGGWWMS